MQWGELHEGNYRWLQAARGHTTGAVAARPPAPFVRALALGETSGTTLGVLRPRQEKTTQAITCHDNHCALFRGRSPCTALTYLHSVFK